MKYQIHSHLFENELIEVHIPGLFAAPVMWQEGKPAHKQFSKPNTFQLNLPDGERVEATVKLPLFDPSIKVVIDGKEHIVNEHQSKLAKSATIIPTIVLAYCLVFTELPIALAVLLLIPLSLLANRATRLNPLSSMRNSIMVMSLGVSALLLVSSFWPMLSSTAPLVPIENRQLANAFYEVVIEPSKIQPYNRDEVVFIVESFRNTEEFFTFARDLDELEVVPDISESIYLANMPKHKQPLWVVRFDISSQGLDKVATQQFANQLGQGFEQFLQERN